MNQGVRQLPKRLGPVALGLALLLILAGCGSSAPTAAQAVRALTTGIPASSHAKPLATGTEKSTPDGGFYYDKSYLRFYYLRRVSLSHVLPLLSGTELKDAETLAGMGPLLEVVALASNSGAATNDVQLTQAVLESHRTAQLVPKGIKSEIQNSYYDPIRPIVVLSNNRLNECSASENPGAAVWMVAVFPPVNLKVRIALVQPGFGSYLPVGRGKTPGKVPTSMYSQDVNGCLQILAQSS